MSCIGIRYIARSADSTQRGEAPNPRAGTSEDSELFAYDLATEKLSTIATKVSTFEVAGEGEVVLAKSKEGYSLISLVPKAEPAAISLDSLVIWRDPREEWRQILVDAWRFYRDFFYDPKLLKQVNWPGALKRYQQLIDHAVTRWDLDHILAEMTSELSTSHIYSTGGDTEAPPARGVGMLGADLVPDSHSRRYRFATLLEGGPWDDDARSPLITAGVETNDYLFALNGQEITTDQQPEPWAWLEGLDGQTVQLEFGKSPDRRRATAIPIKTLPFHDERKLRYRSWVEANRRRVEEQSGSKVGYIHISSTRLSRATLSQFRAQWNKPALIFDVRYNSGGDEPYRLIELFARQLTYELRPRSQPSSPIPAPFLATRPSRVLLVNGHSASGADLMAWLFRNRKLGRIVGSRTRGAGVGTPNRLPLIDGGEISVPTLPHYDEKGQLVAEGKGVEPHHPVDEFGERIESDGDPQLEKAIEEALKLIRASMG